MSTNYITKITGTDNVTYDINEGVDTRIFRATCSTAADTAAKVATLDDATNYSLAAGVRVAVTFTYGNSATTPTLNINNGGAKTIVTPTSVTALTSGNGTTYNTWGAYETVIFTYNGTYWVKGGTGYADYNAYNRGNIAHYREAEYYGASYKSLAACYRYILLFSSIDGINLVPVNSSNKVTATTKTLTTNEFNPFGDIFYYATTTAVSAGGTFGNFTLFRQYELVDFRYSFNTGETLTAKKAVYMVCAPQSNGMVKLYQNGLIVQSLPSTDDGLVYIYLGQAYDTYRVSLVQNHPVYWYKNGKIQTYPNIDESSGSSQRRIIFVGDSYGVGYNSQSSQPTVDTIDNWVDLTASRMGLTSSNYFNWCVSGAGFLASTASLNWNDIINANYSNVSSIASTITDVVIGGGINDANTMNNGSGVSQTPTLISKIETVITNLKGKFPNAKIWLAPFGWCRGVASRRSIMANNVFYAYQVAANQGAVYVQSAEFVLHNYGLMQPDYYHPNVEGENAIADVMSNALQGSPLITCSRTRNGNNQGYLYTDMHFTINSQAGVNFNVLDDGVVNFLSYMDGHTCFFYSSLYRVDWMNYPCDGTKYRVGTVTAGHFAGNYYGANATGTNKPYWPAFSSSCSIKYTNQNVYTSGTLYLWFEEPSNTGATGGTVDVYISCVALDSTGSTHAWLTGCEAIFDLNFKNCSMPAGMC